MTTPDDDSAPTTNMADDEDAQQPEHLLPCAVCTRKFNPRSLEKHVKICERTAARKRKPFDSAKQRIQGTELAEFLPKQQLLQPTGPSNAAAPEPRRSSGGQTHAEERLASRRPNNQWKQSRDEFLRAIRAARGDNPQQPSHTAASHQTAAQPPHSQPSNNSQQRPSTLSLVTSPGAPTRSNEKGQCPTCQRQFGVKSYDRHVAFCKERSTRLPASPQTSNNVAKERLEARMKYRAPALKNRRPTNREKYSPGGAQKVVAQSPLLARSTIKDQKMSVDTGSPKLPILKRPGQTHSKESPAGPLKSRPIDRSNSGAGKDYNPFLLAEQQLNDLFSDTSDQSSTDGSAICPPQKPNSSPGFPVSMSSAFVKYPNNPSPLSPSPSQAQPNPEKQQQQQQQLAQPQQQRISLIAPPTGFDDLTSSDLSSDCTETNSLSRELLTSSSNSNSLRLEREHVLGRRVIIDPNQALGGGEFAPPAVEPPQKIASNGMNSGSTRLARPLPNRSNSMRAASAPKPPERKISSSSSSGGSDFVRNNKSGAVKQPNKNQQNGNHYKNNLNGSNLSLSSIISSTDLEMKRSNSLFDELLSSFEDEANSTSTLPSLMSLIRTDASVLSSTPQGNGHHLHNNVHQRMNRRINCSDDDGELSSPESSKRQECGGKLSADSAYSSLNRKYSNHHGRSSNDVSGKLKLSKFCHECGAKFPDSAKFCCECGVKRLTL